MAYVSYDKLDPKIQDAIKSITNINFPLYQRGPQGNFTQVGTVHTAATPELVYKELLDYVNIDQTHTRYGIPWSPTANAIKSISGLNAYYIQQLHQPSPFKDLLDKFNSIPGLPIGAWAKGQLYEGYKSYGYFEIYAIQHDTRRANNLATEGLIESIALAVSTLIAGGLSSLFAPATTGVEAGSAGSTGAVTSETLGQQTTSLQAARFGLGTYQGATPSAVSLTGASATESPLYGSQLGISATQIVPRGPFVPTSTDWFSNVETKIGNYSTETLKSVAIAKPLNEGIAALASKSDLFRGLMQILTGDLQQGLGTLFGNNPPPPTGGYTSSLVGTNVSGGGSGGGSYGGAFTTSNPSAIVPIIGLSAMALVLFYVVWRK